jgi:hypothetical protein
LLNGSSKTTQSILSIAAEGMVLGVWTSYDADVLRYLISVLERPIVDIRSEMEEQPRLRVSAGYYYRSAEAALRVKEEVVANIILRVYNTLHGVKYGSSASGAVQPKESQLGRFSEKLVVARASLEPDYPANHALVLKMTHLVNVAGEIREAYNIRSRLLERISYRDRPDSTETEE